MNVVMKVPPARDPAKIAHSIMAYDRSTDELDLELPIPLFLDTLALKVARVPPEDKFGASSYPLERKSIEIFQFLLGLDVDIANREYFLESTVGHVAGLPRRKLEALELMTEVTPHPRYARTEKPRISERELVLPTLRLLDRSNRGWMTTSDLISHLTRLFAPSGQEAEILEGRHDTHFSQKVRNMISHRTQRSSFIHRGLANHKGHGLEITELGRCTVGALLL
jgi:hypothetical protein